MNLAELTLFQLAFAAPLGSKCEMNGRSSIVLFVMLLTGSAPAQVVPTQALKDKPSRMSMTGKAPLPRDDLPDSPGTLIFNIQVPSSQVGSAATPAPVPDIVPCVPVNSAVNPSAKPCPPPDPYRPFLNSKMPIPLLPRQKGYLAFRDVTDPFNLMAIGLNAGFTIGINSHTAYGPGLAGFGWYSLYSLSQDATGEFIGTFGVCSLLHEDPHYHRMAHGKAAKRLLYALSRTWVAQSDTGHLMPNYEKFITHPASATISNLYVPGIASNAPSTVERVLIGLASDPIDNLITEFLPDFANRIHVHVVFVQQLINQVAAGQT